MLILPYNGRLSVSIHGEPIGLPSLVPAGRDASRRESAGSGHILAILFSHRIGEIMGLKKNWIRATLGVSLIGLVGVLGCGDSSSTKTAPEPNVGPAGPAAGPGADGKTPAK